MNKHTYRIGDYAGTIYRVTALGDDLHQIEPLSPLTGMYLDHPYIITTFVLNCNYRRKLGKKVVDCFIRDGGYERFPPIR